MTICARRGCGVDFDATSQSAECVYHPGRPVFRDQLKSWSCCNDTNKPVLDFDDFVLIKGCARAEAHTDVKQPLPEDPSKAGAGAGDEDASAATGAAVGTGAAGGASGGGDSISTADMHAALPSALTGATLLAAQNAEAARQNGPASSASTAANAGEVEEEGDPEDAAVPEGAPCKRTGCDAKHDGRKRSREQEECRYHPKSAIFREGSKGYACCKRRVLEFAEFLTIEPCATSKKGHLFVGQPKAAVAGDEEAVDCRLDHYETPADIRLTVYAKGADMDRSRIDIKDDHVEFSICLPPPSSSSGPTRRFRRRLALFSEIDPAASTFTTTKFKIDLVLVKKEPGASWPSLERTDRVFGYGLTFGRASDAKARTPR